MIESSRVVIGSGVRVGSQPSSPTDDEGPADISRARKLLGWEPRVDRPVAHRGLPAQEAGVSQSLPYPACANGDWNRKREEFAQRDPVRPGSTRGCGAIARTRDERRPKSAPRYPIFQKFGQVYMTTAYSGVVKAWHLHRVQADHFAVVLGMIKLVLYDDREGSPTKGALYVFYLGEHSPVMVRVPPLVFHGFKAVNETEAIVINVSTEPYDPKNPDEYRLPPHTDEIPYDWARKDG